MQRDAAAQEVSSYVSVCSGLRIISQYLKKTTKFLMTQKPEAFILADRKQHV